MEIYETGILLFQKIIEPFFYYFGFVEITQKD